MMSDPFATESDLCEPEPASTAGARPNSPPLGIFHLLLWMTCSAVLIASNLAINRAIERKTAFLVEEQLYFDSVLSIIEGPAVAAIFIWIARLLHGVRFPVQPGEWLLLLTGFSSLTFLFGKVLWVLLPVERGNSVTQISLGVIAAAYLLGAIWPPLPKWWRMVLLAKSGMFVIELIQYLIIDYDRQVPDWLFNIVSYLFLPSYLVLLAVLITCVVVDRARTLQRGWLHWTGVATAAALLFVAIGQHAFYRWLS